MDKNKRFGIGLAVVSLVAAIAAGIFYGLVDGRVPLAVLSWPALGLLTAVAIIFFNFAEVGLDVDDEIEQFQQLIKDDIEDLQRGLLTPTHGFVAATLLAVLVQFWLLLWYRKDGAAWGPVNVLVVALIVVAITLFVSVRSRWFQRRRQRLSPRIFIVPAAGWLICAVIGVRFAEPLEFGGVSPMERSSATRSVAYIETTRTVSNNADVAFNLIPDIDCDDEGCLFILLIVIVVAVVLASATIPHFWVVATTLLLTLMAVIAVRELLYHRGST